MYAALLKLGLKNNIYLYIIKVQVFYLNNLIKGISWKIKSQN